MDVFLDDAAFAAEMEEMYLNDLANCTEIVLADTARSKARPVTERRAEKKKGGGSVRKATAGTLNAATSISSAIAKKTPLWPGRSSAFSLSLVLTLLAIALSFLFFPTPFLNTVDHIFFAAACTLPRSLRP